MITKKEFYNIKCDCCGQLLDDENYWDEIEGVESMLETCGWKTMEDGKHYCHECFHYDDNDMLVTKDGHIYDECGYEVSELLSKRLSDCNLSVRCLCCLKAAELETVRDLCRCKKTDLLKFRNFGKRSLMELEEFLEKNGLTWEMEV